MERTSSYDQRVTYGNAATREALAGLTRPQREWAVHSEQLWSRAHAIAAAHPGIDVSDVYHALRCLEATPSRRLAAGFRRGRLRADPS
jgi:hypothetical protein